MQLHLIRHGQSYVNLQDRTQGNTDEGLTALGQRQAEALATWLPTHLPVIHQLYASTMRRAAKPQRWSRQPMTVRFSSTTGCAKSAATA